MWPLPSVDKTLWQLWELWELSRKDQYGTWEHSTMVVPQKMSRFRNCHEPFLVVLWVQLNLAWVPWQKKQVQRKQQLETWEPPNMRSTNLISLWWGPLGCWMWHLAMEALWHHIWRYWQRFALGRMPEVRDGLCLLLLTLLLLWLKGMPFPFRTLWKQDKVQSLMLGSPYGCKEQPNRRGGCAAYALWWIARDCSWDRQLMIVAPTGSWMDRIWGAWMEVPLRLSGNQDPW